MNRIAMLAAAALLVLPAMAVELPDLGGGVRPVRTLVRPAPRPTCPVWEYLAGLPQATRENSLVAFGNADARLTRAEELWGRDRFDEAIVLVREAGPDEVLLTCREPEPVPQQDWGPDVRVSTTQSVRQVRLDRNASTGLLYCVLRYSSGGNNAIEIRRSTDGGLTWPLWAGINTNYEFPTVSATCLGPYLYVGYPSRPEQTHMTVYRLNAGLQFVNFPNGSPLLYVDSVAAPDSVVDLCIGSNADERNDRFLLAAVLNTGEMRYYQMDTLFGGSVRVGVPADARGGLDFAWNSRGPGAWRQTLSYIDTLDRIRVLNCSYGPAQVIYRGTRTTSGNHTALAAWRDTVLVAFDWMGTVEQAKYLTCYGDTTSWLYGQFGDTLLGFTRSADVTGRGGFGQGVAFWQYPNRTNGISFTWRRYRGSWDAPVRLQDTTTYSDRLPAIECLDGDYGIAFISYLDGLVYFDRNDWTGIADRDISEVRRTVFARPVAGRVRVKFQVIRAGPLTVRMLDALGRLVAEQRLELGAGRHEVALPAARCGLYFVTVAGAGVEQTARTFVVR